MLLRLKYIYIKWTVQNAALSRGQSPNKKNDQVLLTRKLGDQKKADVLQVVIKFAAY